MIYEAVHDLFTLLIIDYSLMPIEFQYIVILFEFLTMFMFLKVFLYPIRMVLAFMYGTGRALFPRMYQTPRTRSFRQSDEE